MDSYISIEKYENELLVPLDSEFITAFPINRTSYKLLEIYKIKIETVKKDFGIWNEDKLYITGIPWYWRRRDFKNETLITVSPKFVMGKVSRKFLNRKIHGKMLFERWWCSTYKALNLSETFQNVSKTRNTF